MHVAELARLDRAVVELAKADRDGGKERIGAAITAVALAWIKLDEREQACKLQAQGTLVKLPVGEDDALLPSLLTLSDVFPTGHHGAATAGVNPRTTVTVIGDGAFGGSSSSRATRAKPATPATPSASRTRVACGRATIPARSARAQRAGRAQRARWRPIAWRMTPAPLPDASPGQTVGMPHRWGNRTTVSVGIRPAPEGKDLGHVVVNRPGHRRNRIWPHRPASHHRARAAHHPAGLIAALAC